jgi:hypothetical protein
VTSLRSHHKIPLHRPAENKIQPWLNLTKAAAHLGISGKTLRLAAESAEIEALHPLPEGPWIFRSPRSTDLPPKPLSNVPAGSSNTPQDHLYFC